MTSMRNKKKLDSKVQSSFTSHRQPIYDNNSREPA